MLGIIEPASLSLFFFSGHHVNNLYINIRILRPFCVCINMKSINVVYLVLFILLDNTRRPSTISTFKCSWYRCWTIPWSRQQWNNSETFGSRYLREEKRRGWWKNGYYDRAVIFYCLCSIHWSCLALSLEMWFLHSRTWTNSRCQNSILFKAIR